MAAVCKLRRSLVNSNPAAIVAAPGCGTLILRSSRLVLPLSALAPLGCLAERSLAGSLTWGLPSFSSGNGDLVGAVEMF
jgi:hypothetical protein